MKKNYLKIAFGLMIAVAPVFTSCSKDEEPKNTACDIVAFSVNGEVWSISSTNITHAYPAETKETSLTPTITLSPGATVNPPSGTAQNFFTEQGITYTVTAEDGATRKTYTIRATRTPSAACDILTFTVEGTVWDIDGTDITYSYPLAAMLMPVITLSPGATVNPPSGTALNFFAGSGVTYTVTAEDGATKKTYNAKAAIIPPIASGATGACRWTLTGTEGNYTLTIGGSGAMMDYSNYLNSVPWYAYREDIKTVVIQEGVTTIGNYAFYRSSGLTGVTIPNSVTTIGYNAFYECSGLTEVTIGNSVTTIGSSAFMDCSGLTKVTIPNSVTTIAGSSVFAYCSGLTGINVDAGNSNYSSADGVLFNKNKTELIIYPAGKTGNYTIPNSVTTIGDRAFYECSGLTGTLTIPNSVTVIGKQAFRYCGGLTGLTIGNSVTTIDKEAFYECRGLTGLTIGNSVTVIGEGAFAWCIGLTKVTIPNSVITIDKEAFYRCHGLTGLTIGNSVTVIGEWAFHWCSYLTGTLTIPNSVTVIGKSAFDSCDGLTGLTIGNSVTTIGDYAFNHCSYLTNNVINLNPVPQSISSNVFNGTKIGSGMLRVPAGSVSAYKAADGWKAFGNTVAIP
jgi:hypothetical protein